MKKLSVMLGLLLMATVSMFAQTPGQVEVFGTGAYTGNAFNTTSGHFGFGLETGVTVAPHVTIVGQFTETPFIGVKNFSVFTLEPGLRLNLVSEGRVVPYVLATSGLLRAGGVNQFGFGLGGGLLVHLTDHVDSKFELKAANSVWAGNVGGFYPVATVGIGYRF